MSNHTDAPIEILLIENNEGDVFLTKKALQQIQTPNNITVALDGDSGIRMLKQEGEYANLPTPDIILLDINLPKKNGNDVLAEIKADDKLKRIPVIVLSCSNAEQDIARAYELHASSYIIKPINVMKFKEVVDVLDDFWFNAAQLPRKAS